METAPVAEMMQIALGPCCEKDIILAATSCIYTKLRATKKPGIYNNIKNYEVFPVTNKRARHTAGSQKKRLSRQQTKEPGTLQLSHHTDATVAESPIKLPFKFQHALTTTSNVCPKGRNNAY